MLGGGYTEGDTKPVLWGLSQAREATEAWRSHQQLLLFLYLSEDGGGGGEVGTGLSCS